MNDLEEEDQQSENYTDNERAKDSLSNGTVPGDQGDACDSPEKENSNTQHGRSYVVPSEAKGL